MFGDMFVDNLLFPSYISRVGQISAQRIQPPDVVAVQIEKDMISNKSNREVTFWAWWF